MDDGAIFISYRRVNSGSAVLIADNLAARFGERAVVLDVDIVQPGDRWADVLENYLSKARVLVAVIDRGFLGDEGNQLKDPSDFVRVELESALRRKPRIPVIQVRFQEADMPAREDLPHELYELQNLERLEFSISRRKHDIAKLGDAVAKQVLLQELSQTDNSFRNLASLMDKIDADEDTTKRLLVDIGARESRTPRQDGSPRPWTMG